jgi:hypothetical protein
MFAMASNYRRYSAPGPIEACEAERLAALVHAVAVGTRSTTEAYPPQRRVRSAGISL